MILVTVNFDLYFFKFHESKSIEILGLYICKDAHDCVIVCLVYILKYQSTGMTMSRWQVNLTTRLSDRQLHSPHTLVRKRRRMTVKKFHDQSQRTYGAGIELMTPGSAIRLAAHCATGSYTHMMV